MSALERVRRIAQLGIGLLLIGILLQQADVGQVVRTLRDVDALACIAGLACRLAVAPVEIGRLALAYSRYPISLGAAAHLHFTGVFFANFLPGSVGAELYRLHLLRRLEGDLARPLGLLVLLRASGLTVVGLMALAYGAFSLPRLGRVLSGFGAVNVEWEATWWLGGAVLVGLLLLVTPPGRRLVQRARPAVARAFRTARSVPRSILASISLLSVIVWLLRAGSLYFFVSAFGDAPLLGDMFLVVAAANLLASIPISIGGLGVREGALAGGLAALGVPLTRGVAVALLSRASLWVVSLVGAVLYLVRGRVGREELLG